ncbi:rubrerythrin family protein [Brachyspira hampsonii]|uniref:Rubrerythrin n=2 Tax=Brachyspira hampsonii TaxID=1287055 RepID=A0A2U4FNM3_9SPIR|nr:ferritin family protein [Brachyspira hampsonii]EKV56743.1 rubrerythrin [Brachyspira hampsonii 30446]MBW5390742.1 rubrerythrin family protein [Brachyspira hampsonii]MBW5395986.1 rubrerythrin family protein [Brachyspira hampsonii]OEJ17636.1 rubrerythrin [Brachyspira hampsonii]
MIKKFTSFILFLFIFAGIVYGQTAKSTLDGMMQSYNGEMNASATYAEYAKKTQNKSVAAMFKAASAAEALHAKLLNDMALSSKLSTKALTATINTIKSGTDTDNLKSGIAGETYEYTKMYPAFSKVASQENNKNVSDLMNRIASVEKTHAALYNKTMQDLNANKTLPTVYYLCPVCGYVEAGSAPAKCPLCNATASSFQAFN